MTNKLLPFRFERLTSGDILLTNELGYFTYLDSTEKLEQLISTPHEFSDENDELETKFFLAKTIDDYNGALSCMTSSLAYRYQSALVAPFLFMVVPTLRCDHNCLYCQVSRVNENIKGFDLELGSISNIISVIKKYGNAPYKIEFQGGEPLLAFTYIQKFIFQFDKEVGQGNVAYVIATSLSKISDDILLWAKNLNVEFSISLDGTQTVHDANRRHVVSSSHDMVVDGVRKIINIIGRNRVATVTTVTKDAIMNPIDIIDAHVLLGFKDIFVRPISPYGFATKKYESYSIDEYLEFYEILLNNIIDNYENIRIIEHGLLIHLKKIYRSGFNSYVDLKSPAGYVMGALVFDYTGKVFGSDEARMLYKTYEVDSLVLGDVSKEFNLNKNIDLINTLSSTFITETPGCDECAYLPFCGSDPMHHLSTQSDLVGDKSISRFCGYQKGTFDIIFRLLKNDKAKAVFEDWLSE